MIWRIRRTICFLFGHRWFPQCRWIHVPGIFPDEEAETIGFLCHRCGLEKDLDGNTF